MSIFSNFKIKWPKSVEKLENGGRLSPLRQNLPPPLKRFAGSASAGNRPTGQDVSDRMSIKHIMMKINKFKRSGAIIIYLTP